MLIGMNNKGEAKEIKTNENGALMVSITGEASGETTLRASVETLGTTATSISVNKKITSIEIANYSDSASITVEIGTLNAVIGPNIATTLPINKTVETFSLTASAASTQAQIVVKGVE